MKKGDFPLFEGLAEDQVTAFTQSCDEVEFDSGQRFIMEGQRSGDLFFITEGQVRVFITRGGREQDLAEIQAPCVMGEMEFLTKGPRSASVVAQTTVRAHRLSSEKLHERIEAGDGPTFKVFFNVARVIASRLARMNEQLSEVIEHPNARRREELAAFRAKLLTDWNF